MPNSHVGLLVCVTSWSEGVRRHSGLLTVDDEQSLVATIAEKMAHMIRSAIL